MCASVSIGGFQMLQPLAVGGVKSLQTTALMHGSIASTASAAQGTFFSSCGRQASPDGGMGSLLSGFWRALTFWHNENSPNKAYLSPQAGKENLSAIRESTLRWHRDLQEKFGVGFDGKIAYDHAHHRYLRQATFGHISAVLSQCPLTGNDGPPGKRSYDASPMGFYLDPENLRELGALLAAEKISEKAVQRLTSGRYEMYKFEVRVPSDMFGFNLDGCSYYKNGQPFCHGCVFEVFDGGNVLALSAGALMRIARIEIFWHSKAGISLDLGPIKPTFHDIDRYK